VVFKDPASAGQPITTYVPHTSSAAGFELAAEEIIHA
jgi:hypothetical protein